MLRRFSTQGTLLSGLRRGVVASVLARVAEEHGQSLVEFVLLLPVLCLLILGAIDFGRAYYVSIEVSNAALAAASYGMRNPTNTTGITDAANNDAADISGGVNPVVTNGCECSDYPVGPQYTVAQCQATVAPTCTSPATLVNYVKVTTSATYTTLIPWPGIPSSFALSGSARMRTIQ